MKRQYACILLALASFLALGVGAEAQVQREVVVVVPFEFVAAGTTLPAGTYTVSRVSEAGLSGLALSSYENRSSVFVIPSQFESYPGDAKLGFKQIGDAHFLSNIETANGVYSIPVPRSNTAVGRMKQHLGMSASGTN